MGKGKADSLYVGIYGRRNVGKSTLINAITQQEVAIVSPVAGTTTDPVKRSFELLGVGAVVFIDTAGIDDINELGEQRIKKTLDSIRQVDIAILLLTSPRQSLTEEERRLIEEFDSLNTPYLIVYNQREERKPQLNIAEPFIVINAKSGDGIDSLLNELTKTAKPLRQKATLLEGIITPGDTVLLITPIDSEAPEGRLILPQVNTIRDIIDNNAVAIVMKENEAEHFLSTSGIKPALAITDSQLFKEADKLIPNDIPLTSFSILLARQKGNFDAFLRGTPYISSLKDNDRILMLESCSHQSSCEDIGRVKIPSWLQTFTGKKLLFDIVSRLDNINRPIADYALVIQCGGCMVTRKQLINRLQPFINAGIPVANYGMAIAYTQGIFDRATQPFKKQ
ncbi:MAG: [FeFe] hydrogenase H-cluster maturation GTPase HydF [Prevotellaceae bacterium]|jgi:[FeFe] hydrogenase H-cluster maturation GTPase HydF|nr:[FeFe] hydrogenase H-cluster maturation GTPase HydF [Prevotellaceae bacterium]